MSMERQASADETETRARLLLLVGLWWNVFLFFFLRKCGPDDKILDQSDVTSCFCRVRTGA